MIPMLISIFAIAIALAYLSRSVEDAKAKSKAKTFSLLGCALIAASTIFPAIEFPAYLGVIGLLLFAIGSLAIGTKEQRSLIWTVGFLFLGGGLLGLGVTLFLPPGNEVVVPDNSNDPKPSPRPVLSIQEKLDAPWNTDGSTDWQASKLMAELCVIAYEEPVFARPKFEQLGFKSETVNSDSLIGYVLTIGDTAVIVLRGTDPTLADWLADFTINQARTQHGTIHAGFFNGYRPLHPQVKELLKRYQSKKVWLSGHSLGGALAVVSAYQLVIEGEYHVAGVMTFGQPMVVSSELKAFVEPKLKSKYVHFVNDMDPIARVVKPFKHFGHLVWLKDGQVYRSKPDGLRFGNPPTNLEEVPSLEPMSLVEFETFRDNLTKEDQTNQPKRAPDGSIIVEGYFPDFDDHKMIHYLNMMDILEGGGQTVRETFLNE